jgi:hypothetical protein
MRLWRAFLLALFLGFAALPYAQPPDLSIDAPSASISVACTNTSRITKDCHRLDHEFEWSLPSSSDTALAVHRDFLLFDFKQNLRHWPVLANNITRSPPL